MSKTISRTIINTTANVTYVNVDEQAFAETTISLVGKFDEKAILKEAGKRLAPGDVALKVNDIQYDTVMYTMSAHDFVKIGIAGLKPTTRTRYVTTHIKTVIAKILVVNDKEEVERIEMDVTGMSKARIRKEVEGHGYVFVKVIETETIESPYYMTEEDFIAYATAKDT